MSTPKGPLGERPGQVPESSLVSRKNLRAATEGESRHPLTATKARKAATEAMVHLVHVSTASRLFILSNRPACQNCRPSHVCQQQLYPETCLASTRQLNNQVFPRSSTMNHRICDGRDLVAVAPLQSHAHSVTPSASCRSAANGTGTC